MEEAAIPIPFLNEAVVFLAAAGLVVPLLQRLGLSPVLGFLAAGIVIGPFGLGRLAEAFHWLEPFVISDIDGVQHLAELGVVFLLFMIGLELSLQRLWSMRRLVFGVGGLQVLITGAVLAALFDWIVLDTEAAIAVGACCALSSTAVVIEHLSQRRRLATPLGRTVFSTLLFQDLAVVPVLFIIGALGASGSESLVRSLTFSLLGAAVAIAAILAAGRVVIQPVFRFIGGRQNRDVFMAAALLVILATAFATHMAGLSMALGAFLAGLVFADTEFRHQIEADIEPFKGLFLGLFFLSVGMTIDLTVVADYPDALFAAIFGIILIKAAIFLPIALVMRLPLAIAAEGALLLAQIGEFALIGIGLALTLGLVPADVGKVLVVAAGTSMAVTLIVAPYAERLGDWLQHRRILSDIDATLDERHDLSDHVIIAGYGRVGCMVGELLESQKARYIAMEFDSRIVAPNRKAGLPVYFGDIRRADVLKHAGIERATAVVLTMNNPTGNEQVVGVIRRQGYKLPIVARARDSDHAKHLYQLGADAVVLETFEASLQLGEVMFRAIGLPDEAARTIITERREAERVILEQAAHGATRRSADHAKS